MRAAGFVVPQYRLAADEVDGERDQEGVCGRPLVTVDRLHPDVHGLRTGSRTFFHRKKVSR